MAEGHLARIRLPTGVGHETGGDIESQVGRDRYTAGGRARGSESVWIQRESALQSQQDIEQAKIDQPEEESSPRIAGPGLFDRRVNPTCPVDGPFDRSQCTGNKGSVALENLGHVSAESPGDRQQRSQIHGELSQGGPRHTAGLAGPLPDPRISTRCRAAVSLLFGIVNLKLQ